MYDIYDERQSVINSAINAKLASSDEIELYEKISSELDMIQDDSFTIIDSRITNEIDFNIITPYPCGLPEKVGLLFFNTDIRYRVNIVETDLQFKTNEIPTIKNFDIKIKKY